MNGANHKRTLILVKGMIMEKEVKNGSKKYPQAGTGKNSGGDMMLVRLVLMVVAAMILNLSAAFSSVAQGQQIKTSFVEFGRGVPGLLYEPVTPGEKSRIAILMMHPDRDYMTHSVGKEMAERGYRVLCADTSVLKAQSGRNVDLDGVIADVGLGVKFLRNYPGVQKIVLFGYSGGGTIMTAYQNIAENGVKACQGQEKIYKCSDRLAGMTPADGVMLVDSNWGLAAMTLFAIDPAVVSNANGQTLNPQLDMFNPQNGFNSQGASTYSDEFMRKFLSAQRKRYNQLIQTALDRLKAIEAGKGAYADDEPFIIAGAGLAAVNSKLYAHDIRLMSHTSKALPLLHADGSSTTEIVHSVRTAENWTSLSGLFEDGAMRSTVRNFLSMNAVRVSDDYSYDEDSVQGIDWSSSYNNPPGNVTGITVPMLVMGMTGSWEYHAAETIYENAKSADKTLVYVEGASHLYTPCKQCEKKPGQFGDTLKTIYDYVDKWLSGHGRFMKVEKP